MSEYSPRITYEQALAIKKEGRFDKAEAAFKDLIKQSPDNAEYWFQLGLVQRFQGDREAAMASQEKAQKLLPENHDVRLERARLHSWNQNYVEAEAMLGEVLEAHPDYADAIELSSNIKRQKAAPKLKEGRKREYLWLVDVGHERSKLSRRPQADWRQSFAQIGHWITDDTLVHVRFDSYQRFNTLNEHYALGITHIFNQTYNGYLSVGHTPDSIFVPQWRIKTGGEVRLVFNHDTLGNTWFTMDAQHDRYKSLNTTVLKPGMRYGLFDNRLELHWQHINLIDENDEHLTGWVARANVQATPDLRLFAGLGNAPETENAITIDTKSRFAGLSYSITPQVKLHLSYAQDKRENSFVRDIMATALSVKF